MSEEIDNRYAGKPLLGLLELYVLDAIGEISAKESASMILLEPKLREIYESDGDWREVISSAVGIEDVKASTIRSFWEQNSKIAVENNLKLNPRQFAQMFVDANFIE